jgi:ketosteroid isomerase-like protein
MSRHAKTVEAIYAAFGRGDIPGILAALREDVEWEHDAVDQGIPWLAPRQVAGFFETLRALDIRRFAPKRILADDSMAIAVIGWHCAPNRSSCARCPSHFPFAAVLLALCHRR